MPGKCPLVWEMQSWKKNIYCEFGCQSLGIPKVEISILCKSKQTSRAELFQGKMFSYYGGGGGGSFETRIILPGYKLRI